MKIARHFTRAKSDPYDGLEFVRRMVHIKEEDGTSVFEGEATVPTDWSQTATDILAAKYLWPGDASHPRETDSRQAFDRLAGAWTEMGKRIGVFATDKDAESFRDEIRYLLSRQMGSPNSPQWFNTGLYQSYGVRGPDQGHFYVDLESRSVQPSKNCLEHPQAHACFIQSVEDDLVNEGGIMDLWVREARLFKFGSGSGSNFSSLRGRGEPLASGGESSGLLSFLRIGDAAAGAIRSGGTTRRAAKMVCLDVDHPDVEEFVWWKAREERKVSSLVAGSRSHREHIKRVWEACFAKGPKLDEALRAARSAFIPENYLRAACIAAESGQSAPEFPLLDTDWRHEAYQSVSGQNSNNSVRVSNAFLEAVAADRKWSLRRRRDGKASKEVSARALWDAIARAAWECADPGVQFESTIGEWHTCPSDGPIRASNPCSEYLFLDDTGCNLASINLLHFYDVSTGNFDIEGFRAAVRLWIITLEITVAMAGYPSEAIARRSHQYRTLGLGYANLGALLMTMGYPYSSAEAAAVTAGITALMTGEAYAVSAELASRLGPFERFAANRDGVLRVLRNHRKMLAGDSPEGARPTPSAFRRELVPAPLLAAAEASWKLALELADKHGVRNAQVTAIAPTGTIGLVMDCDTMGIEPEFALVKFKKLAGGGLLRIPNRSARVALGRLGYTPKQVEQIEAYFERVGTLEGAPGLDARHYAIFDCATRSGDKGKRYLASEAHLAIVAAAQPFVSGGVSKTIHVESSASVEEVQQVYLEAWKRGLKAVSIYRSGCKLSQPLASTPGASPAAVGDSDDPSCVECG